MVEGVMKTDRPPRKQILVIDDDPASAEILRATLSHAGFRVIRGSRGRDALLTASRKRPDLILLDVLLPDINGLEICRQIKQNPTTQNIPVIFVSARAHPDDRAAGLEAGAEDYITKPFDPLELVARLRSFFARTRQDSSLDPLTRLPSARYLHAELQQRLASGRPLALLRLDIDDFRIFNHAYGFARGDHAIQVLASILQRCVGTLGDPADMVAHLGGDDFVVVTTPEIARTLCEAIIQSFDREIRTLYRQQDQRRGYLEWQDRLGQMKRYPIMTLSIGVATNENHVFDSHLELLEVAFEVQRYSKTLPGSTFSFDRRLYPGETLPPTDDARSEPIAEGDETEVDRGSRRDAYVSLIAHELRTPATLMQTAIDVLLTLPMNQLSPEQRNCLLLVQQNCRRLARNVSNLANYDMARRTEIGSNVQNFDLQKTVDQVAELAKSIAESKGIRVEVDRSQTLEPLQTDELLVAKSLWEVVHNAIKFSPHGSCVRIRISNDNGNAVVEVTDDGPGMPRAELLRIFRSFYQVEAPDTRRARGLGLGLFIAKRNMESLGGTLTVRSAVGKGSKFVLTFPKRPRSTLERVALLQDQADLVAGKARAELHRLEESLGEAGLPSEVQGSIDNLRAKLLELEVLANRAALLAQQMNSETRRERERLQQLKAQILHATSPLTTPSSSNHVSTLS